MENNQPRKKINVWLDEEERKREKDKQNAQGRLKAKKPKALTEERSYDEQFVAWIDILGIRNKIKDVTKNNAESIFHIMGSLNKYLKDNCDKYYNADKLHYTQIADGVIIACDVSLAREICEIVAAIQWRIFIELGLLSRGAITVGDISVSEELGSMIIGPAYVSAYVVESEIAIFPRIVVTDEAMTKLSPLKANLKFIKQDVDKFWYIDFIEYIIKLNKLQPNQVSQYLISYKVDSVLKEGYNCDDSHIRQKYGWTLSLLESHTIKI